MKVGDYSMCHYRIGQKTMVVVEKRSVFKFDCTVIFSIFRLSNNRAKDSIQSLFCNCKLISDLYLFSHTSMFAKSDWYIVRGLVKGCFENIYWKNPERGFTVQQLSHLFNTEIDITQGLSTYFIGEQRISLLI